MSQLESSLEALFYKRVRLVGGLPVKLAPTMGGLPDRMALFPGGRIYFVELKRENGSARKLQLHRHAKLRELGHDIVVVAGRDELIDWLKRVVDESAPKTRKNRSRATALD